MPYISVTYHTYLLHTIHICYIPYIICYIHLRLTRVIESCNCIGDEQNGFRAGRNTGEHLSTISVTIESRIKRKLDTYVTFIVFSKAYDRIDRSLLWHKLSKIGIDGRMLRSLQSLYEHVTCTVRINGVQSDIFDVKTGLKQGCILSPQLFNMFVNDLIHAINSLESGLCYGDGSNVSILLYADDIVLLSDNEMKMQSMLECLSEWCHTWGLQINFDKSKVMHFRASGKPKIEYQFKCGDS